ncbi:hypothetical protein D9M69_242910 [compost metagenome]
MPLLRPALCSLALLILLGWRPLLAADLFYLGQRIPDLDRPWSSAQYHQLLEALQQLDTSQANALPRRNGEFTGPIYRRMVSEENFRPQLNIYVPLEPRQNEAREVLFQLKELMRLYFNFRAAQQPYGAEALGLMTYSLRQQAVLFTLTTEFWMTLSQKEQGNPMRLQGLQETKAAAAMLTSSALDYLGLTKQFDREDLELYGAELAKLLPELFVHLDAGIRPQLLARVGQLAEQHPYPPVRASMAELLPVLAAIQADVERQLAKPHAPTTPAAKLDLSVPAP